MNDQFIKQMFNDLKKRKNINENKSYTSHLLSNPEFLGKKIGEESSELIIDFIKIASEERDFMQRLLL